MAEFKVTTNEELWEVLGSVDKFNTFLGNYTEFILRKVLLAVPSLVIHHIKNEANYERIKKDFFQNNPELVEYKHVVAQQLNLVAAEHVDWTVEQVFKETGLRSKQAVRKLLEEKQNAPKL